MLDAPRQDSPRLGRRQFIAGLAAAGLPLAIGCRPSAPGTGKLEATWGERGLKNGQLQKPRAITIDADDNLYICDITARIQVYDRMGKYLRGWRTPESKNGRPTGMSVIDGRLYVADTHYFRVLCYSLAGELLPDYGFGTAGLDPGQIGWTTDIARDSAGHLYVTEYGQTERVQKFTAEGQHLLSWGEPGIDQGQFMRPQSVVVDHDDQVWVCDAGNHRLQVFSTAGAHLRSVGNEGQGRGQFSYPYGLVFDADGNLVVCEYGNHRLQKLTPQGQWLGDFGRPGAGPGEMHNPWSCAIDSRGTIHVLDSWNHRIHRVRL